MATAVASITFPAKYCRDERWDVLGREMQKLLIAYKDNTGAELAQESIENALVKAGAKKLDAQLIAGRGPRYQLRSMVKSGARDIVISAYADGSIEVVSA